MSKTNTKINIRVDKATKKEAQKALEEMGMDLSTGIKMFLRSVIITRGLPFKPRTKNGFTPKQEKEMIRETEDAKRSGKRYASIEKAHRDTLG